MNWLTHILLALFPAVRRKHEAREAILRESRVPVADKPQGKATLHSLIAERERRFAQTMLELADDPDLADAARKSGAL